MKNFYIFSIFVIVILVAGCGDSAQPRDLPKLYPCTVVIMQDGKPLEGAGIEAIPVDAAIKKYQGGGLTDASGKAVLATYGYVGLPEGTFRITVSKNVEDTAKVTDPHTMPPSYRTVEEKFSTSATTPFEITVKPGGATETFDVGKAIRKLIK
jgi:hypothetical protein